MKRIILILFAIFFLHIIYADEIVQTKDGRSVILFEDGTWKYTKIQVSNTNNANNTNNTTSNRSNPITIKNIDSIKNKKLVLTIATKAKANNKKIYPTGNEGNYTKLLLETLNNEITIRSIQIYYSDETERRISDNFVLFPDNRIKMITIGKLFGSKAPIIKISINFTAKEEVSAVTKMNIYLVK